MSSSPTVGQYAGVYTTQRARGLLFWFCRWPVFLCAMRGIALAVCVVLIVLADLPVQDGAHVAQGGTASFR